MIIPLFIAMLIIPIINFMFFTNEKKNDIYSAVNQTNHQAMNKIDDYLIDIANITKIPLTYKQKDKSYLRYLSDFNKTGDKTRDLQVMNEQMFEEIFAYKSNIEACYVYNLNGIGDYKVRTPVYNILSPVNLPMFQNSIDMFGKPIILNTYELPYVSHEKDSVYVFGISRGIVSFVESKVVGIIVVVTRTEYFQEISEDMKTSDNQRIIILDNDYVIYDTQEENIATTVSNDIMKINWDAPQDDKTITINGQEYMSSSFLSNYSGWRIISLIPQEEMFHDLAKMQSITLLIITLLVVISLLLGFILSFQIVHPLKKLATLMKLAESGDFDIKVKVNSKDEIGTLAQAFNSMISKINSLIQEVYIEQIRQSELELQMLQSQINPHFIYNTLESISMMATIHDDEATSEMAFNLGSILRYGINKTKEEVTIREELDNLEKYISLQEIRFHSVYTITINVSPNLYNIYIIKLILQPVVENAIYHGMKEIRSGGKIIVTGYKTDNKVLVFEVEDNGKGMTESLTRDLNDYINDKNNLFNSIGLRNVNKRIKIKYGDEYGLEIQSKTNTSTKVIIRLPIEHT